MKKARLIYCHKYGYITYKRNKLTLSVMLIKYDDVIRLVDFSNGLLTVLMRRGSEEIEEYVDFVDALAWLQLLKLRSDYFNGITVSDISLERC